MAGKTHQPDFSAMTFNEMMQYAKRESDNMMNEIHVYVRTLMLGMGVLALLNIAILAVVVFL